jgi:hypothetical protein
MPAITLPFPLTLPAGMSIQKPRNGGPWIVRETKPKDGAQ